MSPLNSFICIDSEFNSSACGAHLWTYSATPQQEAPTTSSQSLVVSPQIFTVPRPWLDLEIQDAYDQLALVEPSVQEGAQLYPYTGPHEERTWGRKYAQSTGLASSPQIARVYFVQVLLLGTGVPEMTQAQALYLELHRLHEPHGLDVIPGLGHWVTRCPGEELLLQGSVAPPKGRTRTHRVEKYAKTASEREPPSGASLLLCSSGKSYGPRGRCLTQWLAFRTLWTLFWDILRYWDIDILRFWFPNNHTVPNLQNDSNFLLEALSEFPNLLP